MPKNILYTLYVVNRTFVFLQYIQNSLTLPILRVDRRGCKSLCTTHSEGSTSRAFPSHVCWALKRSAGSLAPDRSPAAGGPVGAQRVVRVTESARAHSYYSGKQVYRHKGNFGLAVQVWLLTSVFLTLYSVEQCLIDTVESLKVSC